MGPNFSNKTRKWLKNMVGTQTKLKYEQACDLFGDDIELVASLLIMDEPQSLHRRKFLSHRFKDRFIDT